MNIITKVVCIMGLILSLGACTTLGQILNASVTQPVTNAELYSLGNAIGAAEGVADGYAALPLCAPGVSIQVTNICHDKTVLKTLAAAAHAANTAYSDAVAYIKANPTGTREGLPALLQTVRTTLTALQAIETQYNMDTK